MTWANRIFALDRWRYNNFKHWNYDGETKKCTLKIYLLIQCQNKTINDAKSQELAILFQNQPNPFNQSTVIRYQLKNNNEKATIVIRNLNGSIVKQIAINQSGKGQAIINANEMAAGTYTYTLTVNGASVDTKLMVLIK